MGVELKCYSSTKVIGVRQWVDDSSESVGEESGKKSTTGQEMSWGGDPTRNRGIEEVGEKEVSWEKEIVGSVSGSGGGDPNKMGLPHSNWGRHSLHCAVGGGV